MMFLYDYNSPWRPSSAIWSIQDIYEWRENYYVSIYSMIYTKYVVVSEKAMWEMLFQSRHSGMDWVGWASNVGHTDGAKVTTTRSVYEDKLIWSVPWAKGMFFSLCNFPEPFHLTSGQFGQFHWQLRHS